jgi:stage III sporulation protein AB
MWLFVKFILIICVFLLATFIGYMLAGRYKTRVAEINDLIFALDIFETKIKYTYDSLTTTFLYIADSLKTKVYRLFYITAEQLKENRNLSAGECFKQVIDDEKIFLALNKEDIEIIKGLCVSLGQVDMDGQLKTIKLVSESLKKQLQDAIEDNKKNFKLYRNMGVLSGLVIIIILL